jgi:hypothetical protein
MPDVLVLGEEHGNRQYQAEISKSLPCLRDAGYQTLAIEKPQDLGEEIASYIEARLTFDDKEAHMTLWRLLSRVDGASPPIGLRSDSGAPSGLGVISTSLDLFTEASLLGFEIRPVDIPLEREGGGNYGGRGAGRREAIKDTNESRGHVLPRPSVSDRNAHIAKNVQAGTVLIVGRGHTGEDSCSVDFLIRQKGLSVVSVDLVGSDSFFYTDDMSGADIALSVAQLRANGGICGILAKIEAIGAEEFRKTLVSGDVP